MVFLKVIYYDLWYRMFFEGQLRIKITPVRRPESKRLDILSVK